MKIWLKYIHSHKKRVKYVVGKDLKKRLVQEVVHIRINQSIRHSINQSITNSVIMDILAHMRSILDTSSTTNAMTSLGNEGTPLLHQSHQSRESLHEPSVTLQANDMQGMTPDQKIKFMSLQVELYKLRNPQPQHRTNEQCKKCQCPLANPRYEYCKRCYVSNKSYGSRYKGRNYTNNRFKGYYRNYKDDSSDYNDSNVMEFFC